MVPVATLADNSVHINLSGVLVEPPVCTINDGSPIPVSFGSSLGINHIDGVNYKQKVDLQITCEEDPDNNPWLLGLTVTGSPTSFDKAAVQMHIDDSSSTDLGVKMTLDGQEIILNERVEISQSTPPVLEAVPVKNPGSDLPEGAFHGIATLMADYE